jgi:predicted kinase
MTAERKRPTATVTCGLPGAGKSTWAVSHADYAYIVSADAIRERGADGHAVFEAMELNARRALAAGIDVIVDACALDPSTRMLWQRIARELGAASRLVIFATPLSVCQARDATRALEQRAKVDWLELSRKLDRLLERVALEQWDRVTCIPCVCAGNPPQ